MSTVNVEYNPHFQECFESQHRYLILKGGAGSGKSVFAAQKIVARMIYEKGHRFLVLRKVSRTVRESVWELIKQTFTQFGHGHLIKINKTDRVITYLPNGNKIIFAGVDDPEKMKSIVGITGVWLEELTEFDEADLDQVDLRLRGATIWYKQIIGTFNPIDAKHWVKKKFFDEPDPERVMTHESNYLNNEFLDDEYIDTLTNRMKADQNLFNIYVLNKWGSPTTGLEVYTNFKLNRHVVNNPELDPDAPIHATFDFNVVPHVTCNVWQIKIEQDPDDENREIKTLTQIDEFCLGDPLNNTISAAQALATKYKDHKAGVWVYGDPSGKGRDTRSEDGRNDFDIILSQLAHLNPIDRVQSSAPNVQNRHDWLNFVFHADDDIKIRIASHCDVAIEDFQQVKKAADGGKLKRRIKDKRTGVTFEKHGHSADANEYFLTTILESEFSMFLRPIKGVESRQVVQRSKGGRKKSF